MPVCPRCKIDKPRDGFRRRYQKKCAHRLESYCKPCMRAYQTIRHNKTKIKAIKYKGGQCLDCGRVVHPALFEFHHRDPATKLYSWHGKLRFKPWAIMVVELDKCDLLCPLCHHIKHINPEYWPPDGHWYD